MNASQTKLLSWLLAGLLGVVLSLYVGWFVSRMDGLYGRVTTEEMTETLSDVDPVVQKRDSIVVYADVTKSMIDLNWTGRPPAKPAPPPPKAVEPTKTQLAVAELVKVMWISFDSDGPDGSQAVINYTPKAKVSSPANGTGATPGWVKHVGDTLDGDLGHVRVAGIHPHAIEFAFDDEEREHEFVGPDDYPLEGIVVLGNAGELRERPREVFVPIRRGSEPTPKTRELRRNVYKLGFEDTEYINQNYSEILSQEVRYARHRDPRTGKFDGVQIMEVKPGSIASSHGVETGDVIKSINGHAVTSSNEAISYIKNHKDEFDKWEVVIESKGQLVTKVYYSPDK